MMLRYALSLGLLAALLSPASAQRALAPTTDRGSGNPITNQPGLQDDNSKGLIVRQSLIVNGVVTADGGLAYQLNYPRSALTDILVGNRIVGGPTGFDIPIWVKETLEFSGDTFTRHDLADFDLDVSGQINGTGDAVGGNLTISGRHGTDYKSPGASQWSALTGNVTKTPPKGGYDVNGAPQGWSLYTAYSQNTDQPSSVSGSDTLSENDMWQTNLDDLNTRFGHQTSIYTQSGRHYSGDVGRADYIACFASCGTELEIGGAYSVAAIDLHTAAIREPRITSRTPSRPVYSVTVDDVMPLSHGGSFAGAYGFVGGNSTAAITGISAISAQGGTLRINDTSGSFAGQPNVRAYINRGMYVLDLSNPLAVPNETTITGSEDGFFDNGIPRGANLELSAPSQIKAGDKLLFAHGQKAVEINGHPYIISGITLPDAGSDAGTVYFTRPVEAADAHQGQLVLPSAHTIWMWEGAEGKDTYAPNDIAFNRAGTVTLQCNRSENCDGISVKGGLELSGAVSQAIRVISDGSKDSVSTTDYVLAWKSKSVGRKMEVLPHCDIQSKGRVLIVKDESRTASAAQPIEVVSQGSTVEMGRSLMVTMPGQAVKLSCDGAGNWMTL